MESISNKVKNILSILDVKYPNLHTELHYKSPFQLLVATILSAQCTDERVNKVTPLLFKKYKTVSAFANVSQEELEKDIHSTGFFRNKAKAIIGSAKIIDAKYNGNLPPVMQELLELPGVARKTANVILQNAFGKAEGIVVDTHVTRVSNRLGLTKNNNPEKIETDLMKIIPKEKWIDFSNQLVIHGRYVCKARKPLCPECVIKDHCDFFVL